MAVAWSQAWTDRAVPARAAVRVRICTAAFRSALGENIQSGFHAALWMHCGRVLWESVVWGWDNDAPWKLSPVTENDLAGYIWSAGREFDTWSKQSWISHCMSTKNWSLCCIFQATFFFLFFGWCSAMGFCFNVVSKRSWKNTQICDHWIQQLHWFVASCTRQFVPWW